MASFQPMALILSICLGLLAYFSFRSQRKQLADLKTNPHVPEVDRSYIRKRALWRIFNSVLMAILCVMLVYTFASGMERRADELASRNDAARENPEIARIPLNEEEKNFLRLYGVFWICFLFVLFAVFAIAIKDFWATRRYAVGEMKRIREDQKMLLERDLAMVRQNKRDRMGRSSR